ncbi:MAG: hypothetical protein GPOALKHO_001491 [Sodalis sp.]|nr:MAG: hypothetical protein GPOALKHO_001491 [Sodalis sp.]
MIDNYPFTRRQRCHHAGPQRRKADGAESERFAGYRRRSVVHWVITASLQALTLGRH